MEGNVREPDWRRGEGWLLDWDGWSFPFLFLSLDWWILNWDENKIDWIGMSPRK